MGLCLKWIVDVESMEERLRGCAALILAPRLPGFQAGTDSLTIEPHLVRYPLIGEAVGKRGAATASGPPFPRSSHFDVCLNQASP